MPGRWRGCRYRIRRRWRGSPTWTGRQSDRPARYQPRQTGCWSGAPPIEEDLSRAAEARFANSWHFGTAGAITSHLLCKNTGIGMDWDNIRVFLSVARAGQFLAAARQLRVDHGTVSRRIGALETSLGVRLFDRQTTGCVLTAAGERLLESAEEVEAQLLRAQGDLSQSDVELSGTVRIAAPDGFTTLFLCARLGKLKAKYPSLTIQLVPMSRTFSLSKRAADLAITI